MTEDNLDKGGRPKKPIDYKKLTALCAIHCTGEECASVLGVSYEHLNNTLKADGEGGFLDFFKKESGSGKASLRRRQWTAAESGNITMLIWLGKQYLNQADKAREDDDTKAQALSVTFDVKPAAGEVKVTNAKPE